MNRFFEKGKALSAGAVVLVTVLVASLALVGCGGGGKGNVVTMWAMGQEGLALSPMIQAFETENPDLKIELQVLPWDVAAQNIMMAVATGDGPDLIGLGSGWAQNYGSLGALVDFAPFVDKYPSFATENYLDGAIATAVVNGQLVGIPWYVETRVLFYRSDILAEVGWNRPPETWDELLRCSRDLGARGPGFFGLDIVDPNNYSGLANILARNNGSPLIDVDTNTALFDKPEYVETVRFLNRFIVEGHADATGMYAGTDPFGDGYIPMMITGPWSINGINELAPWLKGKWNVALLPVGPKNRTSYMGGAHLVVLKSAKNAEGAMRFVDFLVRPENQLKFFGLVNALPSSLAAWEFESSLKSDPMYAVFGEQLKDALPPPSVGPGEDITFAINQAVERVYIGGEDPAVVLAEANITAQNLLDNQ